MCMLWEWPEGAYMPAEGGMVPRPPLGGRVPRLPLGCKVPRPPLGGRVPRPGANGDNNHICKALKLATEGCRPNIGSGR